MNRIKLLILFFCSTFSLVAQNTMYYMERMPQSISYNPAIMPKMDFFLGSPGINGISLQAYNSGFNYNELDYLIDHFTDINYNPKNFGNNNNFSEEATVNLFSVGFKLKEKAFLSLSLSQNSLLFNTVGSDIAYLIVDRNDIQDDDFPIIVNDINILANNYLNVGVTYSRKINEHLTLGITPKLNFNMAGLKTSDLTFKLDKTRSETGDDEYNPTLDGIVYLGLFTELNPDAIIGNEFDLESSIFPDNLGDNISARNLLRNKSLSIDLGATYELDKWMFSASILNIGRSSYKTNGYILTGNGTKVLVNENEKVKIGIPTKIFLGASRQFAPKWNYALLLNNNFYQTGSKASATLSLNGFVGSLLSTSVSYTAGYKFDNLGIGLRLRFLPGIDLYAVTDNIIQAFNYKNAYRATIAFGINFASGLIDRKKTELPENAELN